MDLTHTWVFVAVAACYQADIAGIHRTGSDLRRSFPPKHAPGRVDLGKRGRGMLRDSQEAGGMRQGAEWRIKEA